MNGNIKVINTKWINSIDPKKWFCFWDWTEELELERKMKFKEFNRIEKTIRELFPNFTDFELHSTSGIIKFRINNVSLENLNKLKEQTNRNINIDKCQFHPELGFWIVLTK